ncbi:hypothetical protein TD95_002415 [Thielaviopsis punctulata]|uniref:Peroxidase n=1 Tax=Thielaviopsis punctulata TaxID=72032 RepID=A0A0F4ZEB0_9PEZI|nr:hypothetical protein TD95_002415 [Thielaviopsis punctulata]
MRTSNLSLMAMALHSASAYVWPNKYDSLEDLLVIQSGYLRFGFTDLVVPCGFGQDLPGINTAGEWMRTAFHDTITHDKAAGTGGLDGSIRWETNRPENPGKAFNDTLGQMASFISPVISTADMIALGLVASVASCGGKRIPLRAGRIDAPHAGPPGVPEPQTNLKDTTAQFAKAGFNVTDMIAMVACGHSIGQVHSVDFPDIVTGTPEASNVAKFDRTSAQFDNKVVSEYLESDGINPLAFGHNDTTNSDKRIFGADGNVTMQSLNDGNTYQDRCQDILARMIDTVPANVTLSDPLDPIDIKPYINTLEINSAGTGIDFAGRIRIRTSASTGRNADAMSVNLTLTDHNGAQSVIPAIRPSLKLGQSVGFLNEAFTWYEFSTTLDLEASAKSFVINVQDGNVTATYSNEEAGSYPIETDLLFQSSGSCLNVTTSADGMFALNVKVAVRSNITEDDVVVPVAHKVFTDNVVSPSLDIQQSPVKGKGETIGPYQIYTLNSTIIPAGWITTFQPSLASKTSTVWPWISTGSLNNC